MIRIKLMMVCLFLFLFAGAQTGKELLDAVKSKLDRVNDYTAKAKLKTNVIFIKAPVADISIFYKKPDKMKIINESGISFIPKGAVNINLNKFILEAGDYEIIDGGTEQSTGLRILKLLPSDENSEIVLSVLYIDEKQLLIKRAKNTSRDNGTYELELFYNKQKEFSLPDKVIFSFNVKDYKLPKGVTFDYDQGTTKNEELKNKKGQVEITYTSYIINKGVPEEIFKE